MSRIEYWWSKGGWYAWVLDEHGDVVDDSMKVGFPASIDFRRDETYFVRRELKKEFPEMEIREV